ncbi:auxin-responsive protein IAA16-like [Panicum miliaceum]|uniref:Auxin-responsive protein n=1 Tax=Panicum miliaceum TaxID=4540 RepID=A0A3L6T0T2_PANMI|nr:auxin-responsive protein IAA16-like [Panicum miliaceum]
MAWNGRFGDEEEGRGLELSLGLPGYFSRSPTTQAAALEEKGTAGSAAAAAAAARAKGSNGFKARPAAAAPIVGWPPVRAFRRNLASSSSKPPSHEPSSHRASDSTCAGKVVEASKNKKGLFVKINMDGVPIGRKVDLRAHAGYDTLSAAVDHLFRGLLAAQTSGGEQEVITGVLNGSGEYTLVYEDEEGDQMLVGDVPWEMFISTARRLRVLRSSDLSPSSLRAASRKRAAAEC